MIRSQAQHEAQQRILVAQEQLFERGVVAIALEAQHQRYVVRRMHLTNELVFEVQAALARLRESYREPAALISP